MGSANSRTPSPSDSGKPEAPRRTRHKPPENAAARDAIQLRPGPAKVSRCFPDLLVTNAGELEGIAASAAGGHSLSVIG